MEETHYCSVCGDESFVAVGHERVWLCVTHFNDYLSGIRQQVQSLLR